LAESATMENRQKRHQRTRFVIVTQEAYEACHEIMASLYLAVENYGIEDALSRIPFLDEVGDDNEVQDCSKCGE
jgi:hypothetical protein